MTAPEVVFLAGGAAIGIGLARGAAPESVVIEWMVRLRAARLMAAEMARAAWSQRVRWTGLKEKARSRNG
jgi:hypothetical protein